MRFLKKKIFLAEQALNNKLKLQDELASEKENHHAASPTSASSSTPNTAPNSPIKLKNSPQPKKSPLPAKQLQVEDNSRPTKNMAMNYGKAIASFLASHICLPYLDPQLEQTGVRYLEFIQFIDRSKAAIRSITNFRHLLIVTDKDDAKLAACKRILKALSEVFIKYFSVNWIIHGKVTNKLVYLKYRSKMLRRIQNPENFTYIKRRERRDD